MRGRDGAEYGRIPVSQVSQGGIRAGKISFVDDDDVSHFQQPGFHRLHLVAETRRHDCHDGVGDINHVHFVLTDSNGLDKNHIVPRRLQYHRSVARRLSEPSMMSASGHAPDIDLAIERMLLHPDAVAEQGAACDGAADIDRQDPDLHTQTADRLPRVERPPYSCLRPDNR